MDNYPDFSGKYISITIKDDEISHDLFDPKFENQAGRIFITGITPHGATESNWVSGIKSAVAWDRVTDYFLFDDIESYNKAVKISEEYNAE